MRFSDRFEWSLTTNRLADLLEERRRAGAAILDLTEANPTRAGLAPPATEVLPALSVPGSMTYQPEPRGLQVAREAVAGYYHSRGLTVSPDHLHLTASSSESYSFIFKLLASHGDSVLVPQPSYPLFEFLATLEGVRLRPYQLEYHHPAGWRIDFDSLRQAIEPRSRALIIVSPNNPTGSFLSLPELEQINRICGAHELAIIADEVFSDYAIEESSQRVASLVGNSGALTFVLSGLSKVLALPQMKLGWIATSGPAPPDPTVSEAIERLDLIADTFLSVGAPVQHAAPHWLRIVDQIQSPIRERLRTNLATLDQLVAPTPFRRLRVEGGWYAILEVPRYLPEEEMVLRLLDRENLLVHPGYFFDLHRDGFLVVSLLPPPSIFREAVERLIAGRWIE